MTPPHSDRERDLRRLNRRTLLAGGGLSLASIALAGLLQDEVGAEGPGAAGPHHEPKATSCIFLLMAGGPSHIDTFDPKPKLNELHLREFVRERSDQASQMESGKRYYVRSPFAFRKAGAAGIEICEHLPELARRVDDLCIYRGAVAESVNHPTALYHLNTGNQFGTDPALGAWCAYGLGSENRNLPAFVVLPDVIYPQGGSANWSSGYLPAKLQGTPFRPSGPALLDLAPQPGVTPDLQRANLELLKRLNQVHRRRRPDHADLEARMESYELAFRMQAEIPALVDLDSEPAGVREAYGTDVEPTAGMGRRCLLARRLVEAGVRFVQVYSDGWDSHDDIATAHKNRMETIDRPVAALLKDLKQRGLLEKTLVIWGGEFGRSPDNGVRGGRVWGRDHNPGGMTFWLAGGGAAAGSVIGATDETGRQAVEVARPLRDLHVTILHLLGLNDDRLRYFHGGRNKQLSQVGGAVIPELID